MWDRDDHFARWIHGLSAIPVAMFLCLEIYLLVSGSFFSLFAVARNGVGLGAIYLEYRLLKYAITGRDCINNKDQ